METTTHTAQLVVVGGGPGGYTAAFLAADRGLSVTLIDEASRPGGVCLHRGCIPSKALLHAAKVLTDARQASGFGVSFGKPSIDLDQLRGWKNDVVAKLTGGLAQLSKQRKVTYIQGRAAFDDARTVTVTSNDASETLTTITFEHAIIATGSRPARPSALVLDDPRVLDSTDALKLERIPSSLLVIGGGYIGLEIGSVYAALGAVVTIVETAQNLLPGADADLVSVLARRINQVTDKVHVRTTVTSLEALRDGIASTLEGPGVGILTETYDNVLVAVGRIPNSDVPGLDKTRVDRDKHNFIVVDEQRRTAESSIFAIGDVAGEPMLAHKAFAEARVAVDAVTGGSTTFNPHTIPAIVFTDPEVAWCGLTETEATATGRQVVVAKFPWGASGRAFTLDRTDGVTKLVLDPESGQVLGVGLVGTGAGELIAEGVLAVEMGATASDLALSVHPHPTLSETLMEAADVFFGESTHFYRPKRG